MAIALRLTKLSDDGRAVTYGHRRDGAFGAAAGKLVRALTENGDASETLTYQA